MVSDDAWKAQDRQDDGDCGDDRQPGQRAGRDGARLPCLTGESDETLVVRFRHEIGDVDPSEVEIVNRHLSYSFLVCCNVGVVGGQLR